MRVLLISAHPVEASFCMLLRNIIHDGLLARGHEVDSCDLYAEDFDPVLSRDERALYHDTTRNRRNVASYVDRLLWAEAVVFCFPVWCYGVPAILKGFFDRVLVPGVAFEIGASRARPLLTNIRIVSAVATYGQPRWQVRLAIGDIPRRQIGGFFRALTGGAKLRYMALYGMNAASDRQRSVFVARVARSFWAW